MSPGSMRTGRSGPYVERVGVDMDKSIKMKRHRWLWLGLVMAVIAVVAYVRHSGAARTRQSSAPQRVGVAKVITGPMPETIAALGTVTPITTVVVLPQLSGYLTKVGFTEGQEVTKGQFLAQIDPRPYQVQLEQYQGQQAKDMALLNQAKSDLDRYEVLERKNSISAQQVSDQHFLVLQDQAALRIDQANIDTAKLDLSYCHIIAPVDGKVGLRLVDPGNYVTPGSSTGIAVITSIVPITVIFSIPQTELVPVLARLQAGATMTATAYSSDDATQVAEGKLTAVDNQVDTSTGTVKLRATFANTDKVLFPNEFVNIHLLVNTLQHATLVPSPAVQTGTPGSYVYLVKPDDTVAVRKVTTGPTNGTYTVIINGLQPGDTVVTDGVDRLSDGTKIAMAGAAAEHEASAGRGGHVHPNREVRQ
jgi:membrane fusion protein, multidrug efflux system